MSATGASGAGASGVDARWVVFVRVLDRSGTLSALAEVFSSRGVSFESLNTLAIDEGEGTMAVLFRGSPRIARVLVRTIERLAVARAVELRAASDPEVRAIAITADERMVRGSLAEVESAVARLRAGGGSVEAVTVLPPR